MILNFFIKCILVGFLTVWLSSCERHSQSNSPTKTEASKGTEPKPSSPPTVTSPETDPATQEPKDDTPSPDAPSETNPATQEPKDDIPSPDAPSETNPITQEPKDDIPSPDAPSEANPTTQKKDDDISAEIKKPLRLPLHIEKKWDISREDIINAGLLEEGDSGLYHYYFEYWFNNMEYVMEFSPSDQYKKNWDQLCHESDCSKGLDLKKIDKSMMQDIVSWLSFIPRVVLTSVEDPSAESAFFLQGFLAPPDSAIKESDENNLNPDEYPNHIQDILQIINHMKSKNTKKIVVNLPVQRYTDPEPFLLLGTFIKHYQVDLYIIGGCEIYCSRYLIPAANTVYMEPYGHIYFNGSFGALAKEFSKIVNTERKIYIEHIKKKLLSQTKDRVNFVSSGLQDITKSNHFPNFMEQFKHENKKASEKFEASLIEFYYNSPHQQIKDFKEEVMRNFVQTLPPEILNYVTVLTHLRNNKTLNNASNYISNTLLKLGVNESVYYETIDVNSLPSQKIYTFYDLLYIAANLVKIPEYEMYFSSLRPYYNIPEKDKPYLIIFPSADLLRDVGINIIGKNNMKMVGIDKNSKETYLYLNNKRIENCKFFEEGASYTTETLYDCLFTDTDQ